MAAYFFDASALVKRFVKETGTTWVANLLRPSRQNTIYISRITTVEVVAALTRRSGSGDLSNIRANMAIRRFERGIFGRYSIVEARPVVANRAMQLAKIHGLRGYDAVQLASALTANDERLSLGAVPLTLISADTELNTAAVAEGLLVDNPNKH